MEDGQFEFSDEMLRTLESRVVYAPDDIDGQPRSVSRNTYLRTWLVGICITCTAYASDM